MIAIMEMSFLLNNSQRGPLSGPNKDAADAARAIFASLAEASLPPYFCDAGGDSTSDLLTNSQLISHCSFFFFFFFFFKSEEQSSRMVRSTITFTCLTSIYFIFSFQCEHQVIISAPPTKAKKKTT
jgi:hypothetical protein